jgi:glycosyltransferase involved in cell wall biosynthesis
VAEGLERYFEERALIVIADGHSKDTTLELVQMFPLPERTDLIIIKDDPPYGKGSGVKSVLEIGKGVGAHSITIVDSDLVFINPSWIELLAKPTLYGRAGLVAPFYQRHKYDGMLTNVLIYPFTKSVYGGYRRQPIGGDFSISKPLLEEFLNEEVPHDFGIDIFITTTALVKNYKIGEAILGRKVHSSTRKYVIPKKHIDPMFRQVVTQMFKMLEQYEDIWVEGRKPEYREIPAGVEEGKPLPLKIDAEKIKGSYKGRSKKDQKIIKKIAEKYGNGLGKRFPKIIASERGVDREDWARMVYAAACYYKRQKSKSVIDALLSLWYGRYWNHVQKIKDMTYREAEEEVERCFKAFKKYRQEFLEKYTSV